MIVTRHRVKGNVSFLILHRRAVIGYSKDHCASSRHTASLKQVRTYDLAIIKGQKAVKPDFFLFKKVPKKKKKVTCRSKVYFTENKDLH